MVDRLLATGGAGAVAGGAATPWGEPCCLADDSCPFQSNSSSSSMRLLPVINRTDCPYFPCLGRFADARKTFGHRRGVASNAAAVVGGLEPSIKPLASVC